MKENVDWEWGYIAESHSILTVADGTARLITGVKWTGLDSKKRQK